MSVLIVASAARTCLGDDAATFAALLRGESGVGPLRHYAADNLNVSHGYHVRDSPPGAAEPDRLASRLLGDCVVEALARSVVDPARQRVVALVGTGLQELRSLERWAHDGATVRREDLYFTNVVNRAAPGVDAVMTIANACSAGGHVLALGQDLLEAGDADAVIVAAADAMSESMLAMIGRFDERPTTAVRPFDRDRTGVLLAEGAAAVVLVPEDRHPRPLAKLLATGLACDAAHETAPDRDGIRRAIRDAHQRAGRQAVDVDLVYAHGTGTALNDPIEAGALREVFGTPGPLVTAVKGALGHSSGAAALTSVAMALHSLRTGDVPAVVGLVEPLPEAEGLRLVHGRPQHARPRLVQVNAFGFGGVNAVSLLEHP
jgi:3-oxoacyl-[acyl-carrier-protein] synthase II